jgi:hypothetical protein
VHAIHVAWHLWLKVLTLFELEHASLGSEDFLSRDGSLVHEEARVKGSASQSAASHRTIMGLRDREHCTSSCQSETSSAFGNPQRESAITIIALAWPLGEVSWYCRSAMLQP